MKVAPPFSLKVSGPQQWVKKDFPRTARTALCHLIYDLVDRGFIESWIEVDKEIRRIARDTPVEYDRGLEASKQEAKKSAEALVYSLPWEKIFDFCQRLYLHIASDMREWDSYNNDLEIVISKQETQSYIADELQRIFLEENLAYSFNQGEICLRGRSHTMKQTRKVEPTLGDPRLNSARMHYGKALKYFQDSKKPDFENAVKEAVCAVEAAARSLFPGIKAKTLGEVMKRLKGNNVGQLPKTIADTMTAIYAFRNSGDGVAHGGSNGGKVTMPIAEYVLSLAASQIILLHEVAYDAESTDIPF